MSTPELPVEAGGAAAAPATALESFTGWIAVAGGFVSLAVAGVATSSVVMRWLFNAPIDGDFEYVKMGTAIAIFTFLAYTQARRGNIIVDTFTSWLPRRVCQVLDAFWDLVFAALIAYLTYCLVYGTIGSFISGETTMQRQIVLWPAIGLSTALSAVLAITAVFTAIRLLKRSPREDRS